MSFRDTANSIMSEEKILGQQSLSDGLSACRLRFVSYSEKAMGDSITNAHWRILGKVDTIRLTSDYFTINKALYMIDKNKIYLYMSRWAFHGGAPGLGLFSFDTRTGELVFLRHLNETVSFGPACLDKEKRILYVCNETNLVEETGYDTGRVYAYRIDPESGNLEELFRQDTYCPFPDYVNFTLGNKYMIVPHHSWATGITNIEKDENGNYVPVTRWMDSAIDLFRMHSDGTIDMLVDVKKHRFDRRRKDYENRVTVPHPHCAVRSPSGKLFAVCDKGDCHVYMYTVDPETEELNLLSRTMSDAPLSESRYCAFHPTKPFFFVNHEHSAHLRGSAYITFFDPHK